VYSSSVLMIVKVVVMVDFHVEVPGFDILGRDGMEQQRGFFFRDPSSLVWYL
jgi:hypothetical protein